MYKDEYGNIRSEISIMDFVQEMDKPYDPSIDTREHISFNSHDDDQVHRGNKGEEDRLTLENATAPLPSKFDVFRRLTEMEEKNHDRHQSVGMMLDEVKKMQNSLNAQQTANSSNINEIRISQVAIMQQNEECTSLLQECQSTNRSSYQLYADCEEVKKTIETKITQLEELNHQINVKLENVSNKQLELDTLSAQTQSKIEWAVSQNEQIANSFAELSEISRSIVNRQSDLTLQDIINGLILLFLEPNGVNAMNKEVGELFVKDIDKFKENVKKSLHDNIVK